MTRSTHRLSLALVSALGLILLAGSVQSAEPAGPIIISPSIKVNPAIQASPATQTNAPVKPGKLLPKNNMTHQPVTIDRRTEEQIRRTLAEQRTAPPQSLQQAYKALFDDIRKLRRAEQAANTSADRCLARKYSVQEKGQAGCRNSADPQCSEKLVKRCMDAALSNMYRMQEQVDKSAHRLMAETSKFRLIPDVPSMPAGGPTRHPADFSGRLRDAAAPALRGDTP